ncbi:hypothetical protein AB2B38_000100 [Balneola sp. MJW-20]|uniref:hypothetical protein n=1 Tax=Gracilimonas aurantiaca TaxID=3234185 RepID=UPI003466C4B6
MEFSRKLTKYTLIAFVLIAFSSLTACDNATSAEDEEEEPVGLRIKAGDVTIIEQLPGAQSVTGTLTINQGASDIYTVALLGETGSEIFLDPEEHGLTFDITDGNIVSINQEPGLDQTYIFTLNGLAQGNTSITVNLLHEGAAEFVSQSIPVEVTN